MITFLFCQSISYSKESKEECEYSFILNDDIGSIYCIYGVVNRSIQTIINYQYSAMKRSRTYMYKPQKTKDIESTDDPSNGLRFSKHNLTITKIHGTKCR